MLWSDAGTGAEKIIDILYDAKGRKLRKTVTDNNTLLYRQHYAGNLEYRFTTANGLQPEAVYFGDGRVAFIENTRRYEYYLKDHLGNIRLTFTDKNNNGVVDVNNTANNEILQENHYYPFGMDQSGPWMNDAALDNAYKYNGKELNTDFGLQWMDYGARWYDGAVGRWFSVDPMADFAANIAPYRYGFNNPILYTDPLGLFESKRAAKAYAREQGIKTGWFRDNKIAKNEDGSWSIDNNSAHTSISDLGGGLGVRTSALIEERGIHLRDIGFDGLDQLSNENFDSYNPDAVVRTDAADIAYAFGVYLGFASPSAKLLSSSNAAANGVTNYSDDLVRAAQKLYPSKAGKIELHHPIPKYLGGDKNQKLVPLDAAYHQQITNEFRRIHPYGSPTPSPQRVQEILIEVYSKFPLPKQ